MFNYTSTQYPCLKEMTSFTPVVFSSSPQGPAKVTTITYITLICMHISSRSFATITEDALCYTEQILLPAYFKFKLGEKFEEMRQRQTNWLLHIGFCLPCKDLVNVLC